MSALSRKSIVSGLIGIALFLSACNASGSGSVSGGAVVEAKSTQSFAVGEEVEVTVSTYNGAIEVRGGTGNQVQVEVTKRGGGDTEAASKADLDSIELSLTQAGAQVKLIATHKGPIPPNSSASFVVTVPAGSTLSATLDNGAITVNGVKGAVTATATNGDITVQGVEKNAISVKTTNGSLTLGGTGVTGVTGTTSNGNVSFQGSLAESSTDSRLEADNGNITLTLSADAQINIDASTANGTLKSDFTIEGEVAPKSAKGAIGATPVSRVVMRTQNGDVVIKK